MRQGVDKLGSCDEGTAGPGGRPEGDGATPSPPEQAESLVGALPLLDVDQDREQHPFSSVPPAGTERKGRQGTSVEIARSYCV